MKRPVFAFEVERRTDAPAQEVLAAAAAAAREEGLSDGLLHWAESEGCWTAAYEGRGFPFTRERGDLEVREQGDHRLLRRRGRLSGWPVVILLGWWRYRSEGFWERVVARIPRRN